MFNLINQAIEYVSNIDYGLLAAKAIVKTVEVGVEVGVEIVRWSLQ